MRYKSTRVRSFEKISAVAVTVVLSGCVTAGYEGQVGNMVTADQVTARREAMKTVKYVKSVPPGYRKIKDVSVRRCHRNFTESAPTDQALIDDLRLAAYAEGGELITNLRTQTKNGLAANCWYVLEGTAEIWTSST